MEQDRELDARGLMCPLPMMKTRAALNAMQPGQVLKVLSTDAGSPPDMEAFARLTRHSLLESRQDGQEYVFLLREGGVVAG